MKRLVKGEYAEKLVTFGLTLAARRSLSPAILRPFERGDVRVQHVPGTKLDARINRISTSFTVAFLHVN